MDWIYNVEYLADYDDIKMIATSTAILEQMTVTKELLIVDIYIISQAPKNIELTNFENLQVGQLI